LAESIGAERSSVSKIAFSVSRLNGGKFSVAPSGSEIRSGGSSSPKSSSQSLPQLSSSS